MKKNTRWLTECAVIAALYVVLTYLSSLLGISSGVIQCRLSEALTALAIFTPSAVYGLSIGCFLSNFLIGSPLFDVIFGSLATLIGVYFTFKMRKKPILALTPPIISNAIIIPLVLRYGYGLQDSIWFFAVTVAIGEFISCGILGSMLYAILLKTNIFKNKNSSTN